MKTFIKSITDWTNKNQRRKEWLWFISLWLGGMISFSILTYPIKALIKSLG